MFPPNVSVLLFALVAALTFQAHDPVSGTTHWPKRLTGEEEILRLIRQGEPFIIRDSILSAGTIIRALQLAQDAKGRRNRVLTKLCIENLVIEDALDFGELHPTQLRGLSLPLRKWYKSQDIESVRLIPITGSCQHFWDTLLPKLV